MRVFVTGGSGFIGQRLVATLIDAKHEVVCLSRSGASSALLAEMGADVLSGDLTDSDSVRSCINEAKPTHVAHCAAEIATQRNKDRIEQVNIRGTLSLIEACRSVEDLKCFLFLSTVVRGEAEGQTFTEDTPIPATTAYGRSKQLGDEMVFQAHKDWGLPGVVLRPSHVYGPGGWFAGLLEDKLFRIPGKGENLWDMVHVDDVVAACTMLLEQAPAGEAFHVVDDEPITMKEFFGHAAQALGRKPYGHAPKFLAKMLKGSSAVISAVRSAKSSNLKLKSLGWAPRHPKSSEALAGVVAEITKPEAATSEVPA
jgi:nucleoside-diphosphate-sugar epimerase